MARKFASVRGLGGCIVEYIANPNNQLDSLDLAALGPWPHGEVNSNPAATRPPMTTLPPLAAPHVEAASVSVGVAAPFWNSGDEAILEEGMYQLAFELDVRDIDALLAQLPVGYAMVHYVFTWEQRRANGGFSTSANVGAHHIHQAALAYERVGMPGEAEALRRMLEQLEKTPGDHAKIQAAYESVENPDRDDWVRFPGLINGLVRGKDEYFYGEAGVA